MPPITRDSLSEVCPYRFEPPISPVRAAHLANKILTTEQLVNICLEGSEDGFVLVEGAGGFYSPLAENGLNADLAVALQLPVLLVADDRLGVLSQVLLNVEAIKMRGLPLAGVVVNQLNGDLNDDMDNSADLRERLDCPVFTMPYSKEPVCREADALIDALVVAFQIKRSSYQGGWLTLLTYARLFLALRYFLLGFAVLAPRARYSSLFIFSF